MYLINIAVAIKLFFESIDERWGKMVNFLRQDNNIKYFYSALLLLMHGSSELWWLLAETSPQIAYSIAFPLQY